MAVPKTRLRMLILALAANLVLAAGPRADEADACSCAGSWGTEEAFRKSDAVFSGEVVEIGDFPPEREGSTTPMMHHLAPVTFDVKGAWKGVSGESAIVHGQGPEASCGLDFERGETYLVFAYRAGEGANSPLQTDFCGATSTASEETARNMLGPPAGSLPDTGGPAPVALVGLLTAAASISAGVLFVRAIRLRGVE